MVPTGSIASLTDIVEAIEIVRDEVADVTLAAFDAIGASAGWLSVK
jgi:hypothetical protein